MPSVPDENPQKKESSEVLPDPTWFPLAVTYMGSHGMLSFLGSPLA